MTDVESRLGPTISDRSWSNLGRIRSEYFRSFPDQTEFFDGLDDGTEPRPGWLGHLELEAIGYRGAWQKDHTEIGTEIKSTPPWISKVAQSRYFEKPQFYFLGTNARIFVLRMPKAFQYQKTKTYELILWVRAPISFLSNHSMSCFKMDFKNSFRIRCTCRSQRVNKQPIWNWHRYANFRSQSYEISLPPGRLQSKQWFHIQNISTNMLKFRRWIVPYQDDPHWIGFELQSGHWQFLERLSYWRVQKLH